MKHTSFRFTVLFILLCFCMGSIIKAQNPKTPMMGWSSWNTFRININETLIQETADAMVAKGLKDAGYTFVNIDDGFFAGRAADGELINNNAKFPNGMKAIVDYIHSKGLKTGIYSEAGDKTCAYYWDNDVVNGLNVGFYGYEKRDADRYFNTWGFDFIKVDYCGAEKQGLNEQIQYTKILNAISEIEAIDRPEKVRFNVCRWMFPGTWVTEIDDRPVSWRISHDIRNNFNETLGIRDVFEHNLYLSAYASPGHFNDMDMMQIGRNTFTVDQEKSHFGLWCMMSSPLMIGCDLRSIPQRTLDIITNKEVIAINQDPLGLQAQVVSRDGRKYVMAKMIEEDQGKVRAVALFNGTATATTMRIAFADIQLGADAQVRDLWAKTDLGSFSDFYETTVPAYGTAMLRIEGEESFDQVEFEGEDAFINEYNGVSITNGTYTDAIFSDKYGASGNYVLTALGGNNKPDNWAEFRRIYSSTGGKYKFKLFYYSGEDKNLTVTVNGTPYPMTGLNSGGIGKRGRAFINEIELQQGYNTIRLSNAAGLAPEIDKFVLLDPNDPGDDNEPDVEVDNEVILNTKFPVISSEDSSDENWYYIQFRNQNGVFHDMGEGSNIETKQKLKGADNQLWKVTGTSGNYTIVNKSGRKITFAGERFQTSSSSTAVRLNIIPTTNATYRSSWEIQRVGQTRFMNQFGGAGFNVEIGEWTKGDAGNSLLFVAAQREMNFLPEVSTENQDIWYYLQFVKNNKVIQDMGMNEELIARDPLEDKDAQLWKLTGKYNEYQLTSKKGNTIALSGETYQSLASGGNSFNFIYSGNNTNSSIWELQRSGQTIQGVSLITGDQIGENNLQNENNLLLFTAAGQITYNFPQISTQDKEIWYYVQFKYGKGVIADMGNGNNLKTQALTKNAENQYWKIIEIADAGSDYRYMLVNKSGRMLSYIDSDQATYGIYQTTDNIDQAVKLNILATTNLTYKPGWEINREGSTRHLTQHLQAGIGSDLTEGTKNNARNPVIFIELDQAEPALGIDRPQENVHDTRFLMQGRTLEITGSDISTIHVYSITGQLLKTQSQSFVFPFAEAGYYLISIVYQDHSVYNRKIMIK